MNNIVIDNFLNNDEFNNLKKVVFSQDLDWKFHMLTVPDEHYNFSVNIQDKNLKLGRISQFVCPIVDAHQSYVIEGELKNIFNPLMENIASLFNNKIYIERIKINSSFSNKALSDEDIIYSVPHIDQRKNTSDLAKSYSAVFYLQNSRAGTLMFREKAHTNLTSNLDISLSDLIPPILNVDQHVTSVENRLIVFETNQFHAGCYSNDTDFRFIININFWVSADE